MYLFLLETGAELLDLEGLASTARLEEAIGVSGLGLSGSAITGAKAKALIKFLRRSDMAAQNS